MSEPADNTDTNPGGEGGKSVADMLDTARKRRRMCVDADSSSGNYDAALDDLKFLTGGENQWPTEAVASRRANKRLILTVNTLPTFLHQVTNDQRMNTPSIKVSAVDSLADPKTAKVTQGLVRHIEYDSNADVARDTAVNSAAAIGFGYYRIMPEWESPSSMKQKLCYKRIRNALAVRIDPLSIEPDGSDMRFCFVESLMGREDFKREYPDAKAAGDMSALYGDSAYTGWLSDQTVLICEYYEVTREPATAVLLSNGEEGFKEDLVALPDGVTIMKERKSTRPKVIWRKITAVDELEKTEILCPWIPVFPVYGDEIDIEGKVIRSGIIRHAKGPCQSYNVMITAATEQVAAAPRAQWLMAEGQEEGHEDEFQFANSADAPYVTYKPTTLGDKLVPPPQRQHGPDVPVGFINMAMHAKDNVKATTGLFDASLGAKGTATSGVQERAQQQEGDVANFHYQDGLLRTVRHEGRCLLAMIPKYYDGERTVRILGEDDAASHVTINEAKRDESGTVTIAHDMGAGKYDLTVSAGPSFTTMRQENTEFFTQALQSAKDPASAAIFGYAAMRNSDAPGAQIVTKMMATTLPPAAKAVLDEENADNGEGGEQQPMVVTPRGPIPADQAGQVIAELEQAVMQAQEALQKADGAKQQAEALKQQSAMREQELEPGRNALEMKKADAEIAKADAAIAQAGATKAKAEAELARALIEKETLPQQMTIEAAQAQEKAAIAAQPPAALEPVEMPSAEEIAAELNKLRPPVTGLSIKSPVSGQTYEVTVH